MKLSNATNTEIMKSDKFKQGIQINWENNVLVKRRALDYRDIHHYFLIYFIAIISVLNFYFKKLKNKKNNIV